MISWRHAARTHHGLVRANNEDSMHAGPHLVAVADGVGGAEAGEVASALTIASISPLDEEQDVVEMADRLRDAVDIANDAIRLAGEADPAIVGMGTTLTALLLVDGRLSIAHVGDSRAYRVRDGELTQLTRDDTYVQMLVDKGSITADDVFTHPHKSFVTKVLQGEPVQPHVRTITAEPGERYMVCSDGLPDAVVAELIEETMLAGGSVDECADRLVELALEGGGPDNVTVIVAEVADAPVTAAKRGFLSRLFKR
ncbi:protein phosphatase 2C domain-containing protein [Phytomonospora sp. NPDC050363]|uniref:PP2C family protein-serine/threonine phosphatase n=1 Tax=Phytomonospora sp. NPDC050363 TaxID=3155642 RepID=UPI0033D8CF0A